MAILAYFRSIVICTYNYFQEESTYLFCTVRLVEVCGEASRPVSLCVWGERPQRDGFSDDRNDDVFDVPPTRVADRAPDDTPEPGHGKQILS